MMNSDEIAALFYQQGQANTWLSKGQANWLYQQYCKELGRKEGGRIDGVLTTQRDKQFAWAMKYHPANAYTFFWVQPLGVAVCKECGKPVDRAIEGELRCQDCYDRSQMSQEEWEENKEMVFWATHCNDIRCKKALKTPAELDSLFCQKHQDLEEQ